MHQSAAAEPAPKYHCMRTPHQLRDPLSGNAALGGVPIALRALV